MPPISPTFSIGPLTVHWYGVIIVLGALAGGYVASLEAKRRGEDPEMVWSALVWVLIGGILGARIYHVLSSPQASDIGVRYYFVTNPLETVHVLGLTVPFPTALMIWRGGLGIFGGIAGGILALAIFVWRKHLTPFSRWLDISAPGLILAQAIGRWGNYINQELYGPPTSLPWGIRIDAQHRIPPFTDLARFPLDATRFHPVFLYESLWNLGVFIVLMVVGRRFEDRLKDGDIFALYLIGYGLGRLLVESLRPDAWLVGSVPTAQIVSVGLILLGVALILWHRRGREEETNDEVVSQ